MDTDPSMARPGSTPARRSGRLYLLLVVLLLLSIAALTRFRARTQQMPHRETDGLHGDSETASMALEGVLAKTPAAERTALLLRGADNASPGLRYASIEALSQVRTPVAQEALEHAFTDSSSLVRQSVLENLWKTAPTRGLRLLRTGLRDEDTWIREAAIQQLAQLPRTDPAAARRCVPALIAALTDASEVIPSLAAHQLVKITGQPWPMRGSMTAAQRAEVVTRWQQWWTAHRQEWPDFSDAPVTAVRPVRADPSPDYALTDLDGHAITPETQRGRVTLLNFWGTWCPPCQKEIPDLKRLDATFQGRPFDIVGVALSEANGGSGLRSWCRTNGLNYRQALADDATLDAFGHIEEVPVSVLIDAQGRVRYRWEGERDFATFQAAVGRLLAETPPRP